MSFPTPRSTVALISLLLIHNTMATTTAKPPFDYQKVSFSLSIAALATSAVALLVVVIYLITVCVRSRRKQKDTQNASAVKGLSKHAEANKSKEAAAVLKKSKKDSLSATTATSKTTPQSKIMFNKGKLQGGSKMTVRSVEATHNPDPTQYADANEGPDKALTPDPTQYGNKSAANKNREALEKADEYEMVSKVVAPKKQAE